MTLSGFSIEESDPVTVPQLTAFLTCVRLVRLRVDVNHLPDAQLQALRALPKAAAAIAELVAEAERKAEIERRRREVEHREWLKAERVRKRAEAEKTSHATLIATIEDWGRVRDIEPSSLMSSAAFSSSVRTNEPQCSIVSSAPAQSLVRRTRSSAFSDGGRPKNSTKQQWAAKTTNNEPPPDRRRDPICL